MHNLWLFFFFNHFLLKITFWLLRSIWLPGVHCILVLFSIVSSTFDFLTILHNTKLSFFINFVYTFSIKSIVDDILWEENPDFLPMRVMLCSKFQLNSTAKKSSSKIRKVSENFNFLSIYVRNLSKFPNFKMQ